MDRTLARGLALTLLGLVAGAVVGVVVGIAHQDPLPQSAPTATLLAGWTVAMFALPPVAILAAWLGRGAPPAIAAAYAFWATAAFTLAAGTLVPLLAFTPEDFAFFAPMDWIGTIGRGVAGAGGMGALAGAAAWLAARRFAREEAAPPDAPIPARVAAPPAQEIVARREPDPEALAIAQRRLALGEITKNDYDELVRRLRE